MEEPLKSQKYLSEHYQNLIDLNQDFRNSNLINLIVSKVKGENILDIGCGSGVLLNILNKKGKKTFGIEQNNELIKLAKKNNPDIKIIKGSAENINKLFKKKVEIITLIDVLEHIEKDNLLIKKLKNKLEEKGTLIIVVPTSPFLYGKRDKNAGHYRRYSKQKLRQIIIQNNFKIIKLRYWNMLGFIPYLFYEKVLKKELNNSLRKTNKRGILKRIINRILNVWFKIIENNIDFGFGLSLICIAKKFN